MRYLTETRFYKTVMLPVTELFVVYVKIIGVITYFPRAAHMCSPWGQLQKIK
jgi:hypothetical protein